LHLDPTFEVSMTRRLVAGGLGTPQQENLADSQVASAEQQEAQADRAIDAARSGLSVLVGQGPDRGLDITRPHLLDPAMVAVPDNLAVDLIGRRADLVAARWQVEAAAKDIKATRSEFSPNVSLGALGGFILLGSGNPLTLPARTYSVGPALTLPLFDGGRLRAQLASDDATLCIYARATSRRDRRTDPGGTRVAPTSQRSPITRQLSRGCLGQHITQRRCFSEHTREALGSRRRNASVT
jgi:hypothetical protein